ncbi:MAG: glycosyl transferase group 1 [Thermoleophilia bacterium]|nr:glycosyl transferase group 1 [Thermoleophilia bacterium]
MRVCIVYDCLFPYTIGGAERWYRNLAEQLASRGHDVTLLTLRQWERGIEPDIPGARVVAAGPRMELYARSGRRRVLPPIVFGMGVLGHLLRHGRRYDVVHTASFPYFSLLAAAAVRRRGGYRLVVDWHEVWTAAYWGEYLGRLGGRAGWRVQRACLRVPQRAFCFSRMHERRLREQGLRGELTRLEGQYDGPPEPDEPQPARPVAVFAGRHIPEKRVPSLVPALALAREQIPDLRGEIYGDGPDREKVVRAISELGADEYISAPGFVDGEVLEQALSSALCLVLPSTREGYGLVVIEASARGVPAVVVDGPDNAATELIEEGVNGTIATSAAPNDLAAAFMRVQRAGPALRDSTVEWFRSNAGRLSLERSLEAVLHAYASD